LVHSSRRADGRAAEASAPAKISGTAAVKLTAGQDNLVSPRSFAARLSSFIDRWQIPEEFILFSTALGVGLAAGLGAVVFRYLIAAIGWIGFVWVPRITADWGLAYVVLVPAVGGLLVGLLVYYFAPEAKGHGVPEVMEAVAIRGGRIRPVVAVIKSLASSICIGSGGSVGREGPIVQIGSAIGSSLGQWLRLSEDRLNSLVACGAAGGIAATFNAPMAGVVFALEIILGGRFGVRYFSSVVVAAVSASVVGRVAFGNAPAFSIPFEYGIRSLWEFVFYAVLGVLAAVVGAIFVRTLYGAEDLFDGWQTPPEWVKPAIGGFSLGLLALVYPLITPVSWTGSPQVYNVGYGIIEQALSSEMTLAVLATLVVLKLLATSLTLGSGGSGGIFAPSLFMGAMLGGAFEMTASRLFPDLLAPPGAYALVGMAAVFAASAHAPLTAVLILFELTGDYRIILPLMLTVVIATLLAQRLLHGESIYTLKLTRRGVRLQRGRDVNLLRGVRVHEVMVSDTVKIPTTMRISDLADAFARTRLRGLLVLDDLGHLWGIVTVGDLDRALDEELPRSTTVAEIGTTWPLLKVAYPRETIDDALTRMGTHGVGRLPVVDQHDPRKLLGLIRREDIIRAYDIALTRRAEIENRAERISLAHEDGADFIEVHLTPEDEATDKSVLDLASSLPKDCVLVSIKRNDRVIIPHGNTVLRVGDRITAFVSQQDSEQFCRSIRGQTTQPPRSRRWSQSGPSLPEGP
jgi:CIC family chloride channel protein